LKCNFGDGTETDSWAEINDDGTANATIFHTYAAPGDYTLTVLAKAGGLEVPAHPLKVKIKEKPSDGGCELMIIQPLVHGSGRIAKLIGS
jgi:hypothetical protein